MVSSEVRRHPAAMRSTNYELERFGHSHDRRELDNRTPGVANFAHALCSDAEVSFRPAASFSGGFTDL